MTNDGDPAFPRTGEGFGNPKYDAAGMSLRDWFAGQAVFQAAMYFVERPNPDAVAKKAFEIADALLKARQEIQDK